MHALLPTQGASESAILERARTVAAAVLHPRAAATDASDRVPHENLTALAEAGLLALAVPEAHGGAGVPPRVLRRFHGLLAEACGTTAFVAIQHASASSLIARSPSEPLKARLLPRMARGERMGTPAFSHLRRSGPPAVRAVEDGDHLVFDGVAPWVTGWGAVQVIALGATLPDQRQVFAALLLDETPGVKAWPPMRLATMTASSTVSITFSNARIPRDRLLFIRTPDEARAADAAGTLNQAPCSLGAAAAAAKLIDTRAEDDPALAPVARALHAEIDTCWSDLETWADRPTDPTFHESALAVRAHCIELGVRAALAAIVATGGSALKSDRHAQRIYREAVLYSVAPQTTALRRATLARLIHRR
ncbi:MAG: acyl-CoA dehydrogenase family protein [Polyangiaceae bacterium]